MPQPFASRTPSGFAPAGPYRFAGAVRAVTPRPNGADLTTDGAVVRVEAVAEGAFRVRYLRPGDDARDTPAGRPFSYAVADGYGDAPPAATVEDDGAEVRVTAGPFRCVIQKNPLRVRFEDAEGHVFAEDTFGMGARPGAVGVWKRMTADERAYGLGAKAWRLDRTGRAFTQWNSDTPGFGVEQDPLYASFPFVLTLRPGTDDRRRAFGLFFDNAHRSNVDLGGQATGHLGFVAEGGELRYYAFFGPAPADVLRRYTEATGRCPLPPRWALGYHQSRYSYATAKEVREVVRGFRDRGLPLDAVHLDLAHMDGYRVLTWNPEAFPDPAGLLADLAAEGVRAVPIVDPGVKVDSTYAAHEELVAGGHLVRYPDGTPYVGHVWPGPCHFPDFTDPEARRWFGDRAAAFLDTGPAGIWTDMNEPATWGTTMPDLVVHALDGHGGGHAEAHNVYALLMARAVDEGLRRRAPDARPFVLSRAGFAGIQRHAALWTGDNVASWEHLRLASQMLLGWSATGFAFGGTDVGGFMGVPTGELFARWMALGSVSPFFRTHTVREAPRKEPWSFGPDVEAAAKAHLKRRYRLLHVLETAFARHERDGSPVLGPLAYCFPDDDNTLATDDAFLVGPDLLAAPVLTCGATARAVYFPAGTDWFDVETGQRYPGGREALVAAPLDALPLFARAGRVVPFGPAVQHTGEPATTVELRLSPGTGTSELFETDGATLAYRRGAFRRTTFDLTEDGPTLRLARRAEGDYASPVEAVTIRLAGAGPLRSVTVDGDALPANALAPGPDGVWTADVPPDFGEVVLVRAAT